jgi:DNA-binding NarL/FixJ family response regulator
MLNGRTVLVLETEFIIALGIQSALQAMGASHVVLARSPDEANQHMSDWTSAALAIVEIETDKPELIAFAQQLARSGVAVIGISADDLRAEGVPGLPGTPILLKPFPDADLAEAVKVRLAQKPWLPEVTCAETASGP